MKDEGDRRHLVVASAVCCRDTAGILASLWRLLAARREAIIVIVAVEADESLCDYTTTTVYNEARNVCRSANGSDGKKDEMPSGIESSEQQLPGAGQSIWGMPTSQGYDAPP